MVPADVGGVVERRMKNLKEVLICESDALGGLITATVMQM
jgi:hypothetical protein